MKSHWLSSVCAAVMTAGCGMNGRGIDSSSEEAAKASTPGPTNVAAAKVTVAETNVVIATEKAIPPSETVPVTAKSDVSMPGAAVTVAAGATAPSTASEVVVRAPIPPPELPPAVQEVVRLAQTSVGDELVVTYIETMPVSPRLNVDQIIHLRDLGISRPVIQALLRRDPAGNADSLAALAITGTNTSPQQTVIIQTGAPPSAPEPTPTAATVPSPGNVILTNYLAATAGGPQTGTPSIPNAPVAPAAPIYGQGPTPVQAPVGVAAPVAAAAAPTGTSFYETLSPYGSWVLIENHGWCWQPSVAVVNTSWRPYCDDGHWLWTDNGWYWNSSYSWGWAPFHYGRWHRHARHGWVWYPGSVWGPAWVTWRYSDSYCGWAPLPPEAVWDVRLGLCHGGSRVSINFGWGLGLDYFSCVPFDRFYRRDVWRHCVPRDRNVTVINNTTIVNNYVQNNHTVINGGLDKGLVERRARQEVRKVAIQDAAQPGQASRLVQEGDRPGAVSVYRPKISGEGAVPPASILARQEAQKSVPPPSIASLGGGIPGRANANSGISGTAPKRAEPASRSSGIRPAVQPSGDALRRELTGRPATGDGGEWRALGSSTSSTGSRPSVSRPALSRSGEQTPTLTGPTYDRPQYRSPQASPSIPPSRTSSSPNPSVASPRSNASNYSPGYGPRTEIRKPDVGAMPRSNVAYGGAREVPGAAPLFRPGPANSSADVSGSRPTPAPVPAARTDMARPPARYESAPAQRVQSVPSAGTFSAPAPRVFSESPRSAPSYSAPAQQQRSAAPTPNYSPTPRGGPSYTPSAAPQSRSVPAPSYSAPARSQNSSSGGGGGGGSSPRPGRSAREQ